MAKTITTTTGMSVGEGLVWVFLVTVSCGILYPVYRARKHKLNRTSTTFIDG